MLHFSLEKRIRPMAEIIIAGIAGLVVAAILRPTSQSRVDAWRSHLNWSRDPLRYTDLNRITGSGARLYGDRSCDEGGDMARPSTAGFRDENSYRY